MKEERYEKGDRVWVRCGIETVPGVVVGHHRPWNLYRVAYIVDVAVDVAGRGPRAVEAWRLSRRRRDEPPTVEGP